MKNLIKLNIIIVVSTCLFQMGCGNDQKTSIEPLQVNQDSALYKYVVKIFHSFCCGGSVADLIKEQLPPFKEIIIYPGKYKLRSYSWGDGQSYRPFVVEVKDSNGIVIDYFAFADEKFYMNKFDTVKVPNLYEKTDEKVSIKEDISPAKLDSSFLTLSKEINELVAILGYSNDEFAIKNLIDVIFNDLLRFQKLNSFHGNIDFKSEKYKRLNQHHILDSTISELELLEKLSWEPWPFIFKCREGGEGYWVLYIRKKTDGGFYLEPKFFGTQLYWNAYW